MQHIHLEECSSTQSVLKESFLDLSKPILVSTNLQTKGFGRKGSEWSHFDYALAFSFTLPLNETLTLTPLEIGCLLANYFGPNILLKWPNDLINPSGEKVGGILCQLIGKNLIVGIGLNLFINESPHFEYPVGSVFNQLPQLDSDFKKRIPLKIYEYIKSNRLSSTVVCDQFKKFCKHLNQNVSIIDGSIEKNGRFIGISSLGEAILENGEENPIKVLTGSLRY